MLGGRLGPSGEGPWAGLGDLGSVLGASGGPVAASEGVVSDRCDAGWDRDRRERGAAVAAHREGARAYL